MGSIENSLEGTSLLFCGGGGGGGELNCILVHKRAP